MKKKDLKSINEIGDIAVRGELYDCVAGRRGIFIVEMTLNQLLVRLYNLGRMVDADELSLPKRSDKFFCYKNKGSNDREYFNVIQVVEKSRSSRNLIERTKILYDYSQKRLSIVRKDGFYCQGSINLRVYPYFERESSTERLVFLDSEGRVIYADNN